MLGGSISSPLTLKVSFKHLERSFIVFVFKKVLTFCQHYITLISHTIMFRIFFSSVKHNISFHKIKLDSAIT